MSLKKMSSVVTLIPKLAISTLNNNVKVLETMMANSHGGRSKQAKGLAYSPWFKCKMIQKMKLEIKNMDEISHLAL
jgi:hypothetical protein